MHQPPAWAVRLIAVIDEISRLVGIIANVRAVVQRRSPQGDCRFEPQGYPAQILGSSTVILTPAGTAHDFSDLATRWTNGVEIMLPPAAAARPEGVLGLLAEMVGALSPETAPVSVRFNDNVTAAAPDAPFLLVGALPPAGSRPHVRFDRGRVAVTDRSDRTLLDLGGFTSGAVAQLVTSDGNPGIWIKPLAADGSLPAPLALELGRGDVGFIDRTGVALAMSTESPCLPRSPACLAMSRSRPTLVLPTPTNAYPAQSAHQAHRSVVPHQTFPTPALELGAENSTPGPRR